MMTPLGLPKGINPENYIQKMKFFSLNYTELFFEFSPKIWRDQNLSESSDGNMYTCSYMDSDKFS